MPEALLEVGLAEASDDSSEEPTTYFNNTVTSDTGRRFVLELMQQLKAAEQSMLAAHDRVLASISNHLGSVAASKDSARAAAPAAAFVARSPHSSVSERDHSEAVALAVPESGRLSGRPSAVSSVSSRMCSSTSAVMPICLTSQSMQDAANAMNFEPILPGMTTSMMSDQLRPEQPALLGKSGASRQIRAAERARKESETDGPDSAKSPDLFSGASTPVRLFNVEEVQPSKQSIRSTDSQAAFELSPSWRLTVSQSFIRSSTHRFTKGRQPARLGDNWNTNGMTFEMSDGADPLAQMGAEGRCMSWLQDMVIHPNSPYRAAWDMTSLLLVLYDMITIPLNFFEPGNNWLFTLMAWCTRLFWSSDLPGTFLTGFLLPDGTFEMRLPAIAKNYLRTWCFLDLTLIIIDWLEVVLSRYDMNSSGAGYGRLGKVGRVFRVMRMMRLLRLARMQQVIRNATYRIHSERLVVLADIVKVLLFILGNAHLMACFWYGIGTADDNNNWLIHGGFQEFALFHKYMLSLHWSLAQFQGGMDEIVADNLNERIYNVVTFLVGFMMSSCCISALTSSMTRLHILSSKSSFQLSVLRRYLVQNHISDKLAMRVQRNAMHAVSENQRLMSEDTVELLQLVSEPLRVELHFEMYRPVFQVHPFFDSYAEHYPQVMQKVCHVATSTRVVSTGDIIFNAGEIPSQPMMYIVCSGTYDYTSMEGALVELGTRQWLTEAALWTSWMHRGTFRSRSDGRVCILDALKFQDIANRFDHPVFHPRAYAKAFVQELNRMIDADASVTDLPLNVEHYLISEVARGPTTRKLSVISSLSQQTWGKLGWSSERSPQDGAEPKTNFVSSMMQKFQKRGSQESAADQPVTKTSSNNCALFEETRPRTARSGILG